MAFGDLVQSKVVTHGTETNIVATLAVAPTLGNLLIFCGPIGDGSIATPPTAPAGFTLLHGVQGGGTWYWWYKISDGTETTREAVYATASSGMATYAEYVWDNSTPTIIKNDDQTNINSNTSSQASGAATPSGSTNICIAAHGSDGNSSSFSGQAVDGSWIEDILFSSVSAAYAEIKLSRLVNAIGSQEATHSDTDSGDQMYGAIATFTIGSVVSSGQLLSQIGTQGMNTLSGGFK